MYSSIHLNIRGNRISLSVRRRYISQKRYVVTMDSFRRNRRDVNRKYYKYKYIEVLIYIYKH